MGLLRLLGIEKYLKKVRTYVDEENVKDRAYTDKKVSENKAATPDWDAESWEAGYIKNRTHCLTDLTVLTKNGDTAYGMLETQYLKIQDQLFPISRGETVILKKGPHISVTYENGQLTLNDPEDFAESLGGVIVAIGINRISEHYIPDTIARRADIPSVDETLMKYLANPYAIEAGGQIPEDLHNLIYPGPLSPIVMSVCVFYEAIDSMHYAITSHSDFEIYANGQMLSYDSRNRVFNYA